MARRVLHVLVLLAAPLAAAPGIAIAQDSLLSGYGGPGGGEQVILGSELLGGYGGGGGGGGGSGGGGTSGGSGPVAPAPLRAVVPASPAAAPLTAAPERPAKSTGPTARARRPRTASTGSAQARSTPAAAPVIAPTPLGAPVRVPYPTTDGASALPLSRDDVLALIGAALLLVLVAGGTRRLTRWQPGASGA